MVKGITLEMKAKNNLKNLAGFLYEAGTLRKTARSHRQTLLTDDLSDNIASHTFRATIIGWFLAKEERANPYKVISMCLFHDLPETRSGDQNWVHKRYVKVFEEEIFNEQFKNLPNKKELLELANEYHGRKTKEAKLAKDADILDQILILREYVWSGNKEAILWLKGEQQYNRLTSKTAKRLAKEIKKQKPSEWWSKLWTEKRR